MHQRKPGRVDADRSGYRDPGLPSRPQPQWMVLVAVTAAIWARLPEGTLKSWFNVVLIGIAGAVATLAGAGITRLSMAHRRKALLIIAVIAGTLAGITLSLYRLDGFTSAVHRKPRSAYRNARIGPDEA